MGKIISIITDWGDGFGAGHAQRMASLCLALAEVPEITPFIINSKKPDFIIGDRGILRRTDPDPASSLIVRDMRDSSREQMLLLKKIAPVLAIDDIGEGRRHADHVLDLLPNTIHVHDSAHYREDCYLYGHNFIGYLRGLDKKQVRKDIDVAVYSGHLSAPEDDEFFQSILPEGARSVILGGGGRKLINIRRDDECAQMDYAGLLLRARVFISHFGISLYEAKLSGCSVLSLNPSLYHSSLADMVLGSVVDKNAGERAACEPGEVRRSCWELLYAHKGADAKPQDILGEAERKLGKCRDFVVSLVSGSAG